VNLSSATLSPLFEGDKFQLFGSEDGASYVLRSKDDFFVANIRGEDAARFRADYEAIRLQFPNWQPDQTLAQLWDQGGYSWLAAQEGE
jgi:hypothetical protein